jgi:sulfite reductase alpha subunit-like flavoprotein
MGWSEYADQYVRFVPENKEAHGLPLTMRFRDLFIRHLDIFGVPRRSFFEVLSYFTKDENLTERLREFASPEGQVLFIF